MRVLQANAVLLVDLSNFVARAIAVAQDGYLGLLLQMLLKLRRQHPHHRFVYAVEGAGTLRRQQLLPCYKEGRVPSPEFNDARQLAVKMLRLTDCGFIKAADGEADDAIASYCREHPNDAIIIVSNDRDLWQLINSSCTVLATIKRNVTEVDGFACRRQLGVSPKEVPLMKALLGDPSDNIPRGVARVHKKKLLRLAADAQGTIEQLPAAVGAADYLTDNDKKKVAAAFAIVKQQLSVTRAWDNLKLLQRQYNGNVTGLKKFLDQYGVEMTSGEVEIIAGGQQ